MNEEEERLLELSNAEMAGRISERERIIKLLESHKCPPDEDLVECWCGSYNEAIALIKGENK